MRLIDADVLKTELEKLRDGWNYYGGEYESAMYQAYDISVDTVDEQPTVQPQMKKGKWTRELIRNEKGGCIGAKMICSECDNDNKHDEYMKFCPNCGAEMKGKENED